jgi:hypothetical protein
LSSKVRNSISQTADNKMNKDKNVRGNKTISQTSCHASPSILQGDNQWVHMRQFVKRYSLLKSSTLQSKSELFHALTMQCILNTDNSCVLW